MIDHDSGDEDRGAPKRALTCAFCQRELWGRIWRTPVFPPMEFGPRAFESTYVKDLKLEYEDLVTCREPACIAQARSFAEQQRIDPEEKRAKAKLARLRREAGL